MARTRTDKITFTYTDDEGDEHEVELPTKRAVCSRCDGHGTHLNPSIGEHAYTPEEFNEAFDEEGREEYFRHGGIYDVTCEECHGERVVDVLDEEACKRDQSLAADLERYYEHLNQEAMWRRESAWEREHC